MADPRILKYIAEVEIGSEWKHKESCEIYVVDSFCQLNIQNYSDYGCYLKSKINPNLAVTESEFYDMVERVQ